MQLYRFDITFSYWILTWYILYLAGIVKASPKLAILLGLIINSTLVLSFIFVGVSLQTIATFVLLMLLMKVIPYWTLRRVPFSFKRDIPTLLSLYLVYLIWLEINKTNPVVLQKNMMSEFKSGKFSPKWTPGTTLIHDLMKILRLRFRHLSSD
jgi:hypothetical protein